MTKKLAEITGTASVLSASILLILATLISPVKATTVSAFTHKLIPKMNSSDVVSSKADEASPKTVPVPDSTNLDNGLHEVYGESQNASANSVFGLNEEKAAQSKKRLISSVLAVSQSASNFPVTVSVSPEEYDLLLYCVGHETRSGSLAHKVLITEVIFNRVQGPKFGSTVKDVIMSPNQFDVMVNYQGWGDWTPDETTVQAVNLVLSGSAPDYSEGAVYFCNPYIVGEGNWFDMTRQVVCEIEGHRFYK